MTGQLDVRGWLAPSSPARAARVQGTIALVALFVGLGGGVLMKSELLTPELDVFASLPDASTALQLHGMLLIFGVALPLPMLFMANHVLPRVLGRRAFGRPALHTAATWTWAIGFIALDAILLTGSAAAPSYDASVRGLAGGGLLLVATMCGAVALIAEPFRRCPPEAKSFWRSPLATGLFVQAWLMLAVGAWVLVGLLKAWLSPELFDPSRGGDPFLLAPHLVWLRPGLLGLLLTPGAIGMALQAYRRPAAADPDAIRGPAAAYASAGLALALFGLIAAALPASISTDDSWWEVGTGHAALGGASLLPAMAAAAYLSERRGALPGVAAFAVIAAFGAMIAAEFALGSSGMPRRYAAYPPELATGHLVSGVAGGLAVVAAAIAIAALIKRTKRRGYDFETTPFD